MKEADAANLKAWRLATALEQQTRDPAKAVELAEKACGLTSYQYYCYLATLGVAHHAAGHADLADRWVGAAVIRAPENEFALYRRLLLSLDKPTAAR